MAALAAPPPPPPWIPEDDLLLKNAVEAGASLEALARGAVRFSRKFTVRELRERWRSLLYDPDVSAEASSRMFHLQLSSDYSFPGPNFPSKFLNYTGASSNYIGASGSGKAENGPDSSIKRKVESVRRIYHSMRKKLRCTDSGGFRHFAGDCGFNVDDFGFDANQRCNENSGGVAHFGHLPVDACCSLGVGGGDVVINYGENDDGPAVGFFECDIAAITDALMNFATAEDGLDFIDGDGEDALEKPGFDGFDSLVAAPGDIQGESVPPVTEMQELVCDQGLQMSIGTGLEIVAEGAVSMDSADKSSISCLETNLPTSEWAVSTYDLEKGNGEIECVLNTEDPEIPCNDDFVPLKRRAPVKKAGLTLRKEEYNHPQCRGTSLTTEAGVLPINSPRHQLVSTEIQNGLPGVKSPTGSVKNVPADVTQGMSIQPMSTSPIVGGSKKIAIDALDTSDVILNSEVSTSMRDVAISEADPSTLDQYEFESDDDIPSFSDVEAMILAMDLCPDDLDSLDMEASRYQSEDSKRTIMRLEQCARSSMQRRIASQGAFAVLYGHHLKHFIKQTEVILGRATDDMDVDIDLTQEGPASKISRRQALIKMEADGSFLLKNLGKRLMSVNGKEVLTGQSVNLSSSCLIEIRGMAFVFEVDHRRVRHFVAKKHKEENIKFEWTEEGIL